MELKKVAVVEEEYREKHRIRMNVRIFYNKFTVPK